MSSSDRPASSTGHPVSATSSLLLLFGETAAEQSLLQAWMQDLDGDGVGSCARRARGARPAPRRRWPGRSGDRPGPRRLAPPRARRRPSGPGSRCAGPQGSAAPQPERPGQDRSAGARALPGDRRRAGAGQRAASTLRGPARRALRHLRRAPGRPCPRARRAGDRRRAVQGPAARSPGHRGECALRGQRRAAGGAARARGRRRDPRRPLRRSRRWWRARAGWPSTRGTTSAASSPVRTRSTSTRAARAAARAQPDLRRSCSCRATAPTSTRSCCGRVLHEPRLPAQPRARRQQHGLLADRPARPAQRLRLHPAQHSATTRLQVRRCASTSATCVAQALQPRVVHRGRPLPHRQAAPAALRAPAYLVEAFRESGRRRRLPRAGVDRLRPAPRGRRDGRRGARRDEEGRGPRLDRRLRARAGPHARRRARARSASRSRCARRWPTSEERRTASRRSPSRSASDQPRDAGHPDRAGRRSRSWACDDRALTLDEVRAVLGRARVRRRARPARVPGGSSVGDVAARAARARARSFATAW